MAAHFPWLPIETAPRNEDVVLLVVGETGKTYPLLRPARLRDGVWVDARTGAVLEVRAIKWHRPNAVRSSRVGAAARI